MDGLPNVFRAFTAEISQQRHLLKSCRELDDRYMDVDSSEWNRRGQRRGWTRQDKNRQTYSYEVSDEIAALDGPPSVMKCADSYQCSNEIAAFGKRKRKINTRIQMAFRLFPFAAWAELKRIAAIKFCASRPEYSVGQPNVIQRMFDVHLDWLAAVEKENYQEKIRIEGDWHDAFGAVTRFSELAIAEKNSDRVDPLRHDELQQLLKIVDREFENRRDGGIRAFFWLVMSERDWFASARNVDESAKAVGNFDGWVESICRHLRPSTGYSRLQKAYQRALAEANSNNSASVVMPKLVHLWNQHEKLIDAYRESSELSEIQETHNEALLEVQDFVEALAIDSKPAAVVSDEQSTGTAGDGLPIVGANKLRDYVPAKDIRLNHSPTDCFPTDKSIKAFLNVNRQNIRQGRPLGNDGKPRMNRLLVHLGDWTRHKAGFAEWFNATSNADDAEPSSAEAERIKNTKEKIQVGKSKQAGSKKLLPGYSPPTCK